MGEPRAPAMTQGGQGALWGEPRARQGPRGDPGASYGGAQGEPQGSIWGAIFRQIENCVLGVLEGFMRSPGRPGTT